MLSPAFLSGQTTSTLWPDGVHRLLEHENLVFLAELADQHQDLLARHNAPPCLACENLAIGAVPVNRQTRDHARLALGLGPPVAQSRSSTV